MGSNLVCLLNSLPCLHQQEQSTNVESNDEGLLPIKGEPSKHQIVLHRHFDDLIRCLDAKGMLLLELLSRDVMDDIDRQVIKIERPVESRMNTKLIYWLARNNSSVYSIFLEALRATNQQHIANLLENKNGERILTREELGRLVSLESFMSVLLDARVGLVRLLFSSDAISMIDYQAICSRSTDLSINKKLLKVLRRCSDSTLQRFFEGLVNTNQSHLLKYFDSGEVIHGCLEISPPLGRHLVREQAIIDHINDVTRHLHSTPISQGISDNRLIKQLAQINVECVCNREELEIVFYFYCPTLVSLNHLWEMFKSGHLGYLIKDLFSQGSSDCRRLQFKMTINNEDYKQCKRLFNAPSKFHLRSSIENIKYGKLSINYVPPEILSTILFKSATLMLRSLRRPSTDVSIRLSSVSSTWRSMVFSKQFKSRLRSQPSSWPQIDEDLRCS